MTVNTVTASGSTYTFEGEDTYGYAVEYTVNTSAMLNDVVALYVDNKPVKYRVSGDSTVENYTVSGVGSSFKWTYSGSTAYFGYSTPVVLTGMNADMYVETGYITVTDASSLASGYVAYNGANYMEANGQLTITAAGTYSINDKVVTTTEANATYTVGTADVTIEAWQTADQLTEAVADEWDTVISGGSKGPGHTTHGTMSVDLESKTINLESDADQRISGTGLVDLATALIADNSIKVQLSGSSSAVNIPEDATVSNYVSSLTSLLPDTSAAGTSVTLLVTVTNAYGQSVTYTVNYTQK